MKKFTLFFLATIVLIYGLATYTHALDWVASTGKEVGLQLQGGSPGAIPFVGSTGSLQQDYGSSALNFAYTAAGGLTSPGVAITYGANNSTTNAGTRTGRMLMVAGSVTSSSGLATVTFATSNTFTSSVTYWCSTSDETGKNYGQLTKSSGTQIIITGTTSDVYDYICVGN